MILFCQFRNHRIHIQCVLNTFRKRFELLKKQTELLIVKLLQLFPNPKRKQIKDGELRGIALGRCYGNLGPCPCINRIISDLGNSASYYIYNCKSRSTALHTLFHSCDRIGSFAGLR